MKVLNLDWYTQNKCHYTHAKHLDESRYRNMWIPMKEAIYAIDYTIGRNTMRTYLKFKGILDPKGKPILGRKCFNFFIVKPIRQTYSTRCRYYDYKVYFISVPGILEIRKMIKNSRLAGANI